MMLKFDENKEGKRRNSSRDKKSCSQLLTEEGIFCNPPRQAILSRKLVCLDLKSLFIIRNEQVEEHLASQPHSF